MFVCRHYGRILAACVGVADAEGTAYFAHFAPPDLPDTPGWDLGLEEDDPYVRGLDDILRAGEAVRASSSALPVPLPKETVAVPTATAVPVPSATAVSEDAASGGMLESKEDTIESLAEETRRLIAELEAPSPLDMMFGGGTKDGDEGGKKSANSPPPPLPLPPSTPLPPRPPPPAPTPPPPPPEHQNSLIIVAQLVCSCIRHVRRPQSKLLGLQLLLRFGQYLDDEARLQRLVPYVMTILEGPDQNALVRATAVRVLRDILALVTAFPASDADIFPKYILPALEKMPKDSEEIVRIAFAESIAGIAETSRRFLEISQSEVMKKATAPAAAAAATLRRAASVQNSADGGGGAAAATGQPAGAHVSGEAGQAAQLSRTGSTSACPTTPLPAMGWWAVARRAGAAAGAAGGAASGGAWAVGRGGRTS